MSKEEPTPSTGLWTPRFVALVVLLVLLLTLVAVSIAQRSYAEPLFIHTTYYFLLVTVVCWAASYLYLAREVSRADVWAWVKENRAGIFIALAVTLVAGFAIHPALRVLADEANLLGTSKNFFFSKTATFTTTGKYYY
ncbi:MAG: hypothetical protein JXP73_04270, partial [Deltaproteobacteria bacterium]|nr:hypothetical protein [Deltaproteobacteria bacterium]